MDQKSHQSHNLYPQVSFVSALPLQPASSERQQLPVACYSPVETRPRVDLFALQVVHGSPAGKKYEKLKECHLLTLSDVILCRPNNICPAWLQNSIVK